jgi:hypothetical protein
MYYQFSSVDHQLDDLLQRICGELQITKTQHDRAETSYNAVANWLAKDTTRFPDFDIDIYPQGSLRIGTTVKPLSKQEFDLDLVCEIKVDWTLYENPLDLLDAIEDRLMENDTYKTMVERKNRCIRLNYKNDFHMDILPACPVEESINGCVKVPDSNMQDWKDSNPKGYAKWFDGKAVDYEDVLQYKLLLEKSAEIEKLPNAEPVELKPPLKRAVQLIKRYRDNYFKENPDNAPISIVLTTLAGTVYNRQGSVGDAISGILEGINKLIPKDGQKLVVLNPMNKLEVLSERWDDDIELYEHFTKFIIDFYQKWNEIVENKGKGIVGVSKALKDMFGEELINKGFEKQAAFTQSMRSSSKMGITSSGLLVLTNSSTSIDKTTTIKRNTFYGS